MKKYLKKSLLIIFFILIISILFINKSNNNDTKIQKILKNKYYSYLPVEAKEYIKDIYENTGEIILTEKNKEDGLPYLNPDYVFYLTLTEEEQSDVDVIPDTYALDYTPTNNIDESDTIPTSYNSRNVNGKNFITPLRNQKSLGICWSFTTSEVAETYLLKTENKSVTYNSQIFSERQLDYATSNNGITDYNSEYQSFINRELGRGGNFYLATTALANGISLVDHIWKEYDDTDLETMELSDVLNYDNSLYELNSTINMPLLDMSTLDMSKESDVTKKEEYLNTIKRNIMQFGSAYVSTGAPGDGCSYYDSNLNNYVVSVDKKCNKESHAMQIIGWDDNITYSYCADDTSTHSNSNSCSNQVTGTGVWILRNSWGKNSIADYPYLTYDSYNSYISFITDMSFQDDKNWDNNYILGNGMNQTISNRRSFNLSVDNNEILKKIKFLSYTQNAKYNITINTNNNTNSETITVTNEQPGLVSVDLSNKNISFDSSLNINISGVNSSMMYSQLFVFTSNSSNTPKLKFNDEELELEQNNYRLYSKTWNIPSNSIITYKLYDRFNNEYSDMINYQHNKVAENNINTLITFSELLPSGTYHLEAIYNNEVLDSMIVYNGNESIGTENNPYVITTPEQLYDINNVPDAYYILGNDIDLTLATRENGKYYNSGLGWTGINNFSGNLNGNNHKIIGLYNNSDNCGLFNTLIGNATIENIILKDFDITCDSYGGILASKYEENEDIDNSLTLNKITIINSKITGKNPNDLTYAEKHEIGGLISTINGTHSNINITNIFMDSKIEYALGNICKDSICKDINGGAGIIKNTNANNLTIKNIEFLGINQNPDDLFGNITSNNEIIENIFSTANIENIDFNNAKNISNYSSWKDFDDNWIIKTQDGIKRFPILKFVDFIYTSFNDINIDISNGSKNILDYITPNTYSSQKIICEIADKDIALIKNNQIIPIKPGKTTIHINSYYDGYEDDIPLNITNSSNKYIVIYEGNGSDDDNYSLNYSSSSIYLPNNTFYKYGYEFNGWNTKSDGTGIHYNEGDLLSIDSSITTLYAQWKGIKSKVYFDANGGNVNIASKDVYYNEKYGTLPIPIRNGYGFAGWLIDEEKVTYNTNVDSITDHTLKASWKYNYNTIVFNPNNNIQKDIYYTAVIKGSQYTIPTINYDGENEFVGWNTKPDGTGDWYNQGSILTLTDIDNNCFVLYAIWKTATPYIIKEYIVDNNYIKDIPINTIINIFKSKIQLGNGYGIEVDTKNVNSKKVLYTGGKTRITYGLELYKEFTNIVSGDTNGDGKINYLDYVSVYNHIQKTKYPELNKKLLLNEYLIAGDMTNDNKINYLDYVKIYNKIKELKGIN